MWCFVGRLLTRSLVNKIFEILRSTVVAISGRRRLFRNCVWREVDVRVWSAPLVSLGPRGRAQKIFLASQRVPIDLDLVVGEATTIRALHLRARLTRLKVLPVVAQLVSVDKVVVLGLLPLGRWLTVDVLHNAGNLDDLVPLRPRVLSISGVKFLLHCLGKDGSASVTLPLMIERTVTCQL